MAYICDTANATYGRTWYGNVPQPGLWLMAGVRFYFKL